MIVPLRLVESFHHIRVFTLLIVGYQQRDKVLFDHFYDRCVAQNIAPEIAAAGTTGDFLKQEKHGFARGPLGEERLLQITPPANKAHLDGLFWRITPDHSKARQDSEKSGEEVFFWHSFKSPQTLRVFPAMTKLRLASGEGELAVFLGF